jgi:hypothetical protein
MAEAVSTVHYKLCSTDMVVDFVKGCSQGSPTRRCPKLNGTTSTHTIYF